MSGTGAGLFGGAGVIGLFAAEFLLLAAMFGIAAGVLAMRGKKNGAGASVVPKQTIENVKTDIKAIKDDVHRMRSNV